MTTCLPINDPYFELLVEDREKCSRERKTGCLWCRYRKECMRLWDSHVATSRVYRRFIATDVDYFREEYRQLFNGGKS